MVQSTILRIQRSIKLVFFMTTLFLFLVGCSSKTEKVQGNKPLYVVTTTSIIADVIRNLVTKDIKVESLMGPGVDPHLYKASPGDITKMNRADLIVYNGLHLEGKMSDILEKLGRKKRTYAIATPISKDHLLFAHQSDALPDPHIWMDLKLWSQTISPLAEQLSSVDSANKALFTKNAKAYIQKLGQLDDECKQELEKIPSGQRVLITAHDAFRYFGKAYCIQVLGVQGISTESEAGLKEINNLVELIVNQHIPAVFIESSISPKNVQALLEGAKSRGEKVKLGGELYSDALGEEGTPTGTYMGMIRHNFKTIAGALR